MKAELRRARRYDTPFSIILLDIDHFKRINDEYGHDVGDRVLCQLVERIGSHLRATDTLARWSGEEFILLLPQTSRDNVTELAQLLRQRITDTPFEQVGRITVLLGVAQHELDDSLNALFRWADEALYRAKESGRNRVETR